MPSKIHQNSRQKWALPDVPSKTLWYCQLIHNNWYPQWIKVVGGKVLLSFHWIFTKRQAALKYQNCPCYWTSAQRIVFLFLRLSVKFCTVCHQSNHPSKCKCNFWCFLRPWAPLLTFILMGMIFETPGWQCSSPPDKPMSVLMTISNEPILCILIVSIFNMFFHMVKVLEIIFKMSGRWTL